LDPLIQLSVPKSTYAFDLGGTSTLSKRLGSLLEGMRRGNVDGVGDLDDGYVGGW
jgi:hypothetical protein